LKKGADFFLAESQKTALELKDFGINLNFAPVADLSLDPAQLHLQPDPANRS
jgi:beta-N-acetylhexosaminidase